MATQFELAKAYAELGLQDNQFNRGVDRVHRRLRALRGAMNAVGKTALRMLAGTAAVAALSVRAAIKQEQAERKLEAVLRATGGAAGYSADELKKMAAELQRVTNYGDETTISAMAVMASFRKIGRETFPDAIRAAQDMSTVMGQDLKGSVVMLAKALNDPAVGLTYLNRAGVTFTVTQRKMISEMAEAGDMVGAQAEILKELAKQFGGAAEAAADPLTQLKNVIGDLAEKVGQELLPYVSGLAKQLTTVGEAAQGAGKDGTDAFASLGGAIAEVIDLTQELYHLLLLGQRQYLRHLKIAVTVGPVIRKAFGFEALGIPDVTDFVGGPEIFGEELDVKLKEVQKRLDELKKSQRWSKKLAAMGAPKAIPQPISPEQRRVEAVRDTIAATIPEVISKIEMLRPEGLGELIAEVGKIAARPAAAAQAIAPKMAGLAAMGAGREKREMGGIIRTGSAGLADVMQDLRRQQEIRKLEEKQHQEAQKLREKQVELGERIAKGVENMKPGWQ